MQDSTPRRPDEARSSQGGGVRILQLSFVVSGELRARVKPWFKQILEVFVCGLSAHNGFILKSV